MTDEERIEAVTRYVKKNGRLGRIPGKVERELLSILGEYDND